MLAENYIDNEIPVLKISDTVRTAVKKMEEANIAQLPVVDEHSFLGMLTSSTAYMVQDPKLTIKGIQLLNPTFDIYPHTHVLEVLKIAGDSELDILPVLNKENKNFVGSIRKVSLFNFFEQMYGTKASGSILVLSLLERDYSLNEISRIVESNGAKILTVFTEAPDNTPFQMLVTLKINLADISRVIVALQRHHYHVVYSYHEEEYKSKDQERLEHLLKFLEI
jgi:acetoin utilization protein AcuB